MSVLERENIKLDNSFTINHLSFGEKADMKKIAQRFPDIDLKSPLDGFS